MSLTLGEKLRQAREERGISISEVAEQTRISPHYLESIENDDYRLLPGGIFNKGFVKSFAKYVDLDEQEALQDYSSLISAGSGSEGPEQRVYRPEVLTDDRHGSSMIPTVIVAVIILGLMTAGLLYLVDYLRNQPATTTPVETNIANSSSGNVNSESTVTKQADLTSARFEFSALNHPVRVIVTSDNAKTDQALVAGTPLTFEPKESINFNYNRWNAQAVQLKINGKTIALPSAPLSQSDAGRIQFTVNKENFGKIWETGAISGEVPTAVADTNANTIQPTAAPPPVPRSTPGVKPSIAANTATNTALKPTATPQTAPASKPSPAKPAANNVPGQ